MPIENISTGFLPIKLTETVLKLSKLATKQAKPPWYSYPYGGIAFRARYEWSWLMLDGIVARVMSVAIESTTTTTSPKLIPDI